MSFVFPKYHKYIYVALLLMYTSVIIDLLGSLMPVNLPILRYTLISLASFCYIKGILQTKVNGNLVPGSFFYVSRGLLFWTIVVVLMSTAQIFSPETNFINFKIIISGKLFIFLFPFIVFSKPSLYLVKKYLQVSLFLASVLIIITVILALYGQLELFEIYGVIFGGGISLVALTYLYHSRPVRAISFLSLVLSLYVNAINARRNQVVFFSGVLIFTALISIFSNSAFVKRRSFLIKISLLSLLLSISFFVFINLEKFTYLIERSKTGIESREDFLEEFYSDFNAHPLDWIKGRGILGTFKSEINERTEGLANRNVIETAYLDYIMRGGVIYILLFAVIAVPAIFKGFFRSKNLLCKAFAAIILINFIDMIGFGIPTLSIKYILIWIGISVCYSAQMRNYSDEYLKKMIGLRLFV